MKYVSAPRPSWLAQFHLLVQGSVDTLLHKPNRGRWQQLRHRVSILPYWLLVAMVIVKRSFWITCLKRKTEEQIEAICAGMWTLLSHSCKVLVNVTLHQLSVLSCWVYLFWPNNCAGHLGQYIEKAQYVGYHGITIQIYCNNNKRVNHITSTDHKMGV